MRANTSIILLIIATGVAAYLYEGCKPAWQFDHLEENAKKVITSSELQTWATNLLAQYPDERTLQPSQLGTNFPPQLLSLAPKLGPHIFVHTSTGPNRLPYIQVNWGSGFLGMAGFLLGSTNFTGDGSPAHALQPGVYFYRRG